MAASALAATTLYTGLTTPTAVFQCAGTWLGLGLGLRLGLGLPTAVFQCGGTYRARGGDVVVVKVKVRVRVRVRVGQ